MKAIQVLGDPSAPKVILTPNFPSPSPPKPGQLLIKVHSAGITAPELGWPELYTTPSRIPGHEITGHISSLPSSYTGPLTVSTPVWAMLHADRGEGMAEYVLAEEEEVAALPEGMGMNEGAGWVLPVLTAMEGLKRGGLKKKGGNEKVLVTGASGAVGRFIVQLAAKVYSAEVFALASPTHHSTLSSLGATTCLDYNNPTWSTSLPSISFIFDTVGGDILHRSWDAIDPQGRIITVGDPAPAWAFGRGVPEEGKEKPGVTAEHFIVKPDREALEEVGRLLEEGKLEGMGVEVFEFGRGFEAWDFAGKRRRGKKAIIQIVEEE